MIKPWTLDQIRQKYPVDKEGRIRLSMNAVLAIHEDQVVLIDPGTADFLPSRLKEEYAFEMSVPLEDTLLQEGFRPEQITDVLFTHLHFDHGSGAFKRIPGNIIKRFPNARYHVLKEHYRYALKPDRVEANSFSTFLLKRLDKIHWLEEWKYDWLRFRTYQGHTRGMILPEMENEEGKVYFATDLIPMSVFMEEEVYCGYDLDPERTLLEKQEFLASLERGSRILFFHDTLTDSVFYP